MNASSKFIDRLKSFFGLNKAVLFFKEFPSIKQWRRFFTVLNKKEKIIVLCLFTTAILSSAAIITKFYITNTNKIPNFGGSYKEGIVGQPRFINPLYLSTQDVDRDITELVFSGLMKYGINGEIIPDLAGEYEVKENGSVVDIFLKKNLQWHDKKPITVDDVLFTIGIIQDPQYQSPQRIKWVGITIEKLSGDGIRFKLPQKYSGFVENLTVKILPKHIFENISPQNMPWTAMSPKYLVGSGPFVFNNISQDKNGVVKEINFKRNEAYHLTKPYLKEISFTFFENEAELLRKAKSQAIDGFSILSPESIKKTSYNFSQYPLMMPRYFAVFFNLRNQGVLQDKRIREALALSVNKNEILENVFLKEGQEASSPILPDFFNFATSSAIYTYNLERASQLLDQSGYPLNTANQKREKGVVTSIPQLFTLDLQLKSTGAEVVELQKCLNKLGLYTGPTDGIFGEAEKTAVTKFQEMHADEILKPENLSKGNGIVKERTRTKLNQVCQVLPTQAKQLSIKITTSDKFPLSNVADLLKKQWEALGLSVIIEKVSLADMQTNVLSKSNFDILLFGEALGSIPDPFPFWHSSQKDYPGLNIAGYSSKDADKLLEKARESQTQEELSLNLEKFQNTLLSDLPAIFLVRPDYVYFLSPSIKGFDTSKITEPAKRFSNIENWYIKTKRVWK